jgi:hypothetical protein
MSCRNLRPELTSLLLAASDCERNVSLRGQFRRVNRLGIEIKSGARLGMSKQALNRLNVFARVNQKSCQAVTEGVEAESLTRFKPDANLMGPRQLTVRLYNCVLRLTANFSPVISRFKSIFLDAPSWS